MPEESREIGEVHTAHVRRVADLDPLVRVPDPDLGRDHTVLWSLDRSGLAVVDEEVTDPATQGGLWVDDRVTRVQLRQATDDVAAVRDLLHRAHASAPGGQATFVSVAARDAALARPLLKAGFAPTAVLAVRRLEGAEADVDPAPSAGLTLREAVPDDLEAVVGGLVAVQRFDSRSGALPERPESSTVVRPGIAAALRDRPGWAWVVERAGHVVGTCQLDPPEDSAWVAGSLQDPAPAYLACLHVDPAARGAGVGSLLVRAAHRRAALAGASTVVLHHSATSPLSVPFWGRAGYRPVFVSWARFVS